MKMKQLLNAATALILISFSLNGWAAIKHFENTNTSGFVYGSYDFDSDQNIFSNINLKVNFSAVGGPSDVNVQAPNIVFTSNYSDQLSLQENIVTDGSSSDSYYTFTSGILVFSSSPNIVIVTQIQRFENLYSGGFGPIDYITPTYNDEDFFITFAERNGSVSAIPEPESKNLMALAIVLLGSLATRRKIKL